MYRLKTPENKQKEGESECSIFLLNCLFFIIENN